MNKKPIAIIIIIVFVIASLGVLRFLSIQKRNKLQQQYESEILMEDENNQFSGEDEQENPYLNDDSIIGDETQPENSEEVDEPQGAPQNPEGADPLNPESEENQQDSSGTTVIEDQILSDIDPNYNIIKPVGTIRPLARNILDVEKYNRENPAPEKTTQPKELTKEEEEEKPAFAEVPETGQSFNENANSNSTPEEEEIIFTTPDPQEVLKKEQEAINNKIESNWKIRKKEDREGE